MIPKFFYDLDDEKKVKMYAELHDRRAMVRSKELEMHTEAEQA